MKVTVVPTDGFAEDEPMFAPFDQARLTLIDGTVIESPPVDDPRGHWSVPLSSDALWAKFEDCTAAQMSPTRARELFDLLQRIESPGRLRDVPMVAFAAE